MQTYILLIIINLLLGWVFMLKNEEHIIYTKRSKDSIRDMNWIGVIICLVFGSVLVGRMLLVHGLSYLSDKIGDEYDWNDKMRNHPE